MIVVTGPTSSNAGAVVRMSFDTAVASSGIVAVSVSGGVARAIFDGAKQPLDAVQKELDSGNPHVAGFALPNIKMTVSAKVLREFIAKYPRKINIVQDDHVGIMLFVLVILPAFVPPAETDYAGPSI